jgi:hypothetical protein
MQSWTEEGYGYQLFVAGNFDKVKQFIIDNDTKKYTTEELEYINECDEEWELEELIDDPVPWRVADIINGLEEYDYALFKGYQSCGDTDQECMLGIAPRYPWNADETITKEKADELLNKYAEILGINMEPEYFEARYFG